MPPNWLTVQDILNRSFNQNTNKLNTGSGATGGQDSLGYDIVGAHSSGTSIAGVVTLTPLPAGAAKLAIQVTGANARFTLDGSAPSATRGFQLKDGDPMMILSVGPTMSIKIIQESATATLEYQWLT